VVKILISKNIKVLFNVRFIRTSNSSRSK